QPAGPVHALGLRQPEAGGDGRGARYLLVRQQLDRGRPAVAPQVLLEPQPSMIAHELLERLRADERAAGAAALDETVVLQPPQRGAHGQPTDLILLRQVLLRR